MKIEIWTDGSSRGNPGRGGWGCILITKYEQTENRNQKTEIQGEVIELGGRDDMTTNNRMELLAAIKGLREVNSYSLVVRGKNNTDSKLIINNEQRITSIEVNTDSQYVKKGMTEWIDGWIARGWKGSNKKPVLNQDLWQALKKEEDKLKADGVKVVWKYVKAHCGISLNERADTIATMCADLPAQASANDLHLYNGPRSGYSF